MKYNDILRSCAKSMRMVLMMLPVLFLGTEIYAQEAGNVTTLTLKDAINQALTTSQDARKARLDVENSNYMVMERKSQAYPNIMGTGELNYNPILQKFALPGEFIGQPGQTLMVALGQKWNANIGVGFDQMLFDYSVFIGLKAAETSREFYTLNAELTEDQIIEKVATNYYNVLVQKRQMTALDSTISHSEKILNILKGLYDNGLAKRIDVDRMSVSFENLKSQRMQLKNGIQILENQLKFLMGLPINTPIDIPDVSLDDIRPQMVADDNVDMYKRKELMALKIKSQLLTYQRESIKSLGLPSVHLKGSFSRQALSDVFPVLHGKSSGANWFSVATVGLSLQVPIFAGRSVYSKIKQAEIEIKQNEEDIAKTKLAFDLDYENARTQISNSIITLNSQNKNKELAEQVFLNTQNNYNNGLATLTDLLQDETSLTNAQSNYSKALLDYKIAEIQLLKARGELSTLLK